MKINEDDISKLSKKIKDNLDKIKITLTFTENCQGYYQTENNKFSEYSNIINEDEMDLFSINDFHNYSEGKNILDGDLLILDKCEINPKSFILLLEKFYEDDNYNDISWYNFTQDYLISCGDGGVLESFGVQGYNGSSENIFLIDREIESELIIDRDSNVVTTCCIKENNGQEWEFKIDIINKKLL